MFAPSGCVAIATLATSRHRTIAPWVMRFGSLRSWVTDSCGAVALLALAPSCSRLRLLSRYRVVLLVVNPVALTVLGVLNTALLAGADVAIARGIGLATIHMPLTALQ